MNTFDCKGELVTEVVIGKRHIWLWHITSENGVAEIYLLQYENEDMEIIDEFYSGRDMASKKVPMAFKRKVGEITHDQLEDDMGIYIPEEYE